MYCRAYWRTSTLIALGLLAIAPAMAQTGPYVTVSSGRASFTSSPYLLRSSFTKRRDSIGVGYGISDLVALEVSYFQVQSASVSYSLPMPGHSTSINGQEKLSGFALGPVLRWQVTGFVTVYTRQSAVAVKDDVSDSGYSVSSRTFWGYQPSLGIAFRLTSKAPISLGVEVNRIFAGGDQAKEVTGFMANLSYGF